eukprot:8681115-Karenia_brevis.AAC.1
MALSGDVGHWDLRGDAEIPACLNYKLQCSVQRGGGDKGGWMLYARIALLRHGLVQAWPCSGIAF